MAICGGDSHPTHSGLYMAFLKRIAENAPLFLREGAMF